MLAALQGCGGSSGPAPGALQRLGAPEDRLNLLVLPEYAEDGSGKAEQDWVTPFEQRTGCDVSTTIASAPGRVIGLMRSGRYDGISARGDVGLALIAGGLVDPVNTDLLPEYAQVFRSLKNQPGNTVDDVTYGVPIGRTANLLVWRPDRVPTDPRPGISAKLIFDPTVTSDYRGRITAYDNPMAIADAALYLSEHAPQLGIDDVYQLDQDQFSAAIGLLSRQRQNVGSYWRNPRQNVTAFARRGAVVGTASQVAINRLLSERVKVRSAAPVEGTTGRSDNWMVSAAAKHPDCMYLWLDHVTGADVNAKIAERTQQAPANEHACDLTSKRNYCDTFMAANEELFDQVHYWTTPLRDCGDGRGDTCKDYVDWARAWAEVTRGG